MIHTIILWTIWIWENTMPIFLSVMPVAFINSSIGKSVNISYVCHHLLLNTTTRIHTAMMHLKGQYHSHKHKIRHHTTTVLWPFFQDHPGEPVPEENFWTLWCKGRLTEADTPTIRLGATASRLTSAHLYHPPIFCRPDALPATQPTVSKHWRQKIQTARTRYRQLTQKRKCKGRIWNVT